MYHITSLWIQTLSEKVQYGWHSLNHSHIAQSYFLRRYNWIHRDSYSNIYKVVPPRRDVVSLVYLGLFHPMKKLELDITPIWINPFKTEKCVPSGSWTVCYWTWPSRNSEFSHTKMVMFHSFLYVYQRLIPAPFRRSQICALLSAGDESQRSALCFGWPVVYRARPPQPGGVFTGTVNLVNPCRFGYLGSMWAMILGSTLW